MKERYPLPFTRSDHPRQMAKVVTFGKVDLALKLVLFLTHNFKNF